MRTNSLRRQHRTAIGLIQDIERATAAPGTLDATLVANLLAKLSGLLQVHFAMEDGSLYPSMLTSANEEAARTAARFRDEMDDISSEFAQFMERWRAPEAIRRDAVRFVAECKAIFLSLTERIDREDRELYALADAMFVPGTPGTAAR